MLAAAENAATMVPSENIATTNMLDANIFNMSPTASAPITLAICAGKKRDVRAAKSAVAIATTP